MWSLVALVFLLPASPLDANLAFQEGRRLSEQFEYEKATFRFREALRDEALGKDRATVLLWLGMTYVKIGEQSAAGDAFLEALRVDPLVTLPPAMPPKILEALEAARRRLRTEHTSAQTQAHSPVPHAAQPTSLMAASIPQPSSTSPTAASNGSKTLPHPAATTAATTTTTTSSAASSPPSGSTPETPESSAAPSTSASPPTTPLLYGGVLLGVGTLGVLGGLGLGSVASATADEAAGALFQVDRQRLNQDAAAQALGANVALGVSGAVAATGLGLVAFGLLGDAP
jgi:hypothetical protein